MAPFRESLQRQGFAGVKSFGMSGNLLFTPPQRPSREELEAQVARATKAVAMVRTRAELGRVLAANPFGEHPQAAVMFLSRPPSAEQRRAFGALDFDDDPPAPVLRGREIFYVFGAHLRGRKGQVDLERVLGVQGTFRAARVVSRLHSLMGE